MDDALQFSYRTEWPPIHDTIPPLESELNYVITWFSARIPSYYSATGGVEITTPRRAKIFPSTARERGM
ncbi:MAG: hypothetical protein RLZZ214_1985 [Verrucomicrobiota bacterium]